MTDHYIGLMSGTSMDGIDAVVASFDDTGINIVATHERPYAETLRYALLRAAATPVDQPLDNIGSLDRQVGECFRDAALEVLEKSGIAADEIRAIGSHGQTVLHSPRGRHPFTMQIGDPNVIAANTLLEHGVRVYIYPGMSHVKAAIYDGWACLGSANFDRLSLRLNRETNVATSNPAAVSGLIEQVFEPDFARAVELHEPLPASWLDYLKELIADQL